jgi:hypothetical protein
MAFMNAGFGARFAPVFFAAFFAPPADFRAVAFFAPALLVDFFVAFVPVFLAGAFFAADLRAGALPAFFAVFFVAALLADGFRAAAFLLPDFFVRAIERLRQRVCSSEHQAAPVRTIMKRSPAGRNSNNLRSAAGALTVSARAAHENDDE